MEWILFGERDFFRRCLFYDKTHPFLSQKKIVFLCGCCYKRPKFVLVNRDIIR